jgi:hypothetical protein
MRMIHEVGDDGMPLCASSRFRQIFGFVANDKQVNRKRCQTVRFSQKSR